LKKAEDSKIKQKQHYESAMEVEPVRTSDASNRFTGAMQIGAPQVGYKGGNVVAGGQVKSYYYEKLYDVCERMILKILQNFEFKYMSRAFDFEKQDNYTQEVLRSFCSQFYDYLKDLLYV
jgi:hypothetical protein